MNILVLGATGMLGSAVFRHLSQIDTYKVTGTTTSNSEVFVKYNVLTTQISDLVSHFDPEYIINCIGKIKPEIDESNINSRTSAIQINSIFPHHLAALDRKYKVIQIATDCVYTGKKGSYSESDQHDAIDVYGKTKSLGEVNGGSILNLRCSIIGRELGTKKSLIEWVLSQPINAQINGFINHKWNGVTTLAFAKIVEGIIKNNRIYPRDKSIHLVPSDIVDKFALVSSIAKYFGRLDLEIRPTNSGESIDRSLRTKFEDINKTLWLDAGYTRVPMVSDMIQEYSEWIKIN